jgi:hypothetical protein
MYKWTHEDHELVERLTAEGLTVAQISNETGLTVGGIKRSRAVNRLTAAKELTAGSSDPKLQLNENSDKNEKISQLESEIASLKQAVESIAPYVLRQIKNEAKRRESDDEPKSGLVFGKR